MRTAFNLSTICYLQQDNKILMLKFRDKWDQRYCAPGGKVQFDETPPANIIREFAEETETLFIYHCTTYGRHLQSSTAEER